MADAIIITHYLQIFEFFLCAPVASIDCTLYLLEFSANKSCTHRGLILPAKFCRNCCNCEEVRRGNDHAIVFEILLKPHYSFALENIRYIPV